MTAGSSPPAKKQENGRVSGLVSSFKYEIVFAGWRREWDSNRRYGIGTCRGDSVAVLDKQKAAQKSGFLIFSCQNSILFGCGDRI